MTNKSKKALKISLGIIIPTTIIFSSYFGAIACIRYNNYIKPNLPKKYETSEYQFNSKVYDLNEQARKYFSMGQNIIEAKKRDEILSEKNNANQYKFLFNRRFANCKDFNYVIPYLNFNDKLFDDIFKTLIDYRRFGMTNNVIFNNKRARSIVTERIFENDVLKITKKHRLSGTIISLQIDFKTKKGEISIISEKNATNINVKFNIYFQK
jgi:lipoprotein